MNQIPPLKTKYLDEIRQKAHTFPDIEKLILYGSRAKGTHEKASDVDLAVIGKNLDQNTVSSLHFQLEEETMIPLFFDVLNYHTLENQNLKDHIDHVGIVIYQK